MNAALATLTVLPSTVTPSTFATPLIVNSSVPPLAGVNVTVLVPLVQLEAVRSEMYVKPSQRAPIFSVVESALVSITPPVMLIVVASEASNSSVGLKIIWSPLRSNISADKVAPDFRPEIVSCSPPT